MKLSKIIEKDFSYGVIYIESDNTCKVELCMSSSNHKTLRYKSLLIDVYVKDANLDLVKHLGFTRYRSWKDDSGRYLNIYNKEKG